MKFYVSGRITESDSVKEVNSYIKAAGHEITFDWPEYPTVKPYDEHVEQAEEFAHRGVKGVVDADVYMFLTHKDGHGIWVEFGAALAAYEAGKSLKIFLIGRDKSTSSFYYHPAVIWKETIQEVWDELGI